MNYHTPNNQNVKEVLPQFALRGNELIHPQKIYLKAQYPSLPYDMVKITGMDGRNVYIRLSRLKSINAMDV